MSNILYSICNYIFNCSLKYIIIIHNFKYIKFMYMEYIENMWKGDSWFSSIRKYDLGFLCSTDAGTSKTRGGPRRPWCAFFVLYICLFVFQVFVASPHKTQPIVEILLKNQPKLIEFLSSFQKERTDDEQFTDEKNYLIKQIRDLKKTAPWSLGVSCHSHFLICSVCTKCHFKK